MPAGSAPKDSKDMMAPVSMRFNAVYRRKPVQ
jgi:hypothetical protein